MKYLIILVLVLTFYAGNVHSRNIQRSTAGELTQVAGEIQAAEREASLRAVFQSKVSRVQRYLLSKGSPLADYAEDLVVCSERYGFHWAFITSLTAPESSLGKKYTLANNPWNWGIYNGKTFSSIREGACHVAKSLRANYDTSSVYKIAVKFAPKSDGNDPVHWARLSEMTMGEIESL